MDKKMREEKASLPVTGMSEDLDDFPLIRSAQEGDKEAYGQLVLRYQKRLFRFVYMLAGRLDAAEDIVQEAFVKAYMALNDFEVNRPFYPWLATIARNLALNSIRREVREKPIEDSETADLVMNAPDLTFSPLDSLIEKENERRFLHAVMSLPIQFRSVFILRTIEDMNYDEIAKYLNISVGTVDSRLHRAREKLVEMLKDLL